MKKCGCVSSSYCKKKGMCCFSCDEKDCKKRCQQKSVEACKQMKVEKVDRKLTEEERRTHRNETMRKYLKKQRKMRK